MCASPRSTQIGRVGVQRGAADALPAGAGSGRLPDPVDDGSGMWVVRANVLAMHSFDDPPDDFLPGPFDGPTERPYTDPGRRYGLGYYDEPGPQQRLPDDQERLRHLVYLDGRLVDVWSEPVQGTAYAAWAARLDRLGRPVEKPAPLPPPHERVLRWLDDVVGGRIALLALDDEALVPGPRPCPPRSAPGTAHDGVEDLVAEQCRRRFDEEFRCAVVAALDALWELDRSVVEGDPAQVVGGLCWLVGRANGRVGTGTAVTQAVLKGDLGLRVSPGSRAARFRERLRDLRPSAPPRPMQCPDLLELGRADVLLSGTRRDLIRLRDRALAAATAVAADEHARASTSLP